MGLRVVWLFGRYSYIPKNSVVTKFSSKVYILVRVNRCLGEKSMSETITLEQIHQDMLILHKEIGEVKKTVEDLRDVELEVRPEYLVKLQKIEKGKFVSREELEKELEE